MGLIGFAIWITLGVAVTMVIAEFTLRPTQGELENDAY